MNGVRDIVQVVRDFADRQGFDIAWSRANGEVGLVRRGPREALFQQVWVDFSGSKQEAVTTYVGISVVWGRGTKGLVELEIVRELATVPGRGYAAIETPDDLRRWAQGLGEHLPRQLRELTDAKGPTLLDRTRVARESAEALTALLPESTHLDEIRRWTERRLADEDRRAALRMADSPGVVSSNDERELYEVTALLIGGAAKLVPGSGDLLKVNLLTEQQAMWRVQLVADLLRRKTQKRRETNASPVSGSRGRV